MMFLGIHVRQVLPAISVPTLVVHRRGDRVVNRRAGQWMASQIPGARYVELPGQDHFPWVGDSETVLDEVEQFVTGTSSAVSERVLATVLLTDIMARPNWRPRSATAGGGNCSTLMTPYPRGAPRHRATR